jgi:hypothetical protein
MLFITSFLSFQLFVYFYVPVLSLLLALRVLYQIIIIIIIANN